MRVSFLLFLRLALALALFPHVSFAQPAAPATNAAPETLSTDDGPDPTELNIATITAQLVQDWQFSRHPFDAEISSKFLDRYIESLDYGHVSFLQPDLDEFQAYRTNLQVYMLEKHSLAPAFVIFDRFLERANQRTAYITNLLHTEKFEFTNHDRFVPDRHTLPNPKNLEEAKKIWHDELRADYLQEEINAPKIAFAGAADFSVTTNVAITLARTVTNPLPFDFLPTKFFDKSAHEIGSLQVDATGSNATIHFRLNRGDSLRKTTNDFFAADGTRLGSISFRRRPAPTETNQDPAGVSIETTPGKAAQETNQLALTPETASPTNLDGFVELNQKDQGEIVKNIEKRVLWSLKSYKELLTEHHVVQFYLTALARAYDPHSDYMGRAEAEDFNIRMRLSLFGIGAQLQSVYGECKIAMLIPDGPAAKSKQLGKDDIIVAVAQKDKEAIPVNGMPLQKVVDMIRGPRGTPVTLTITPAHPTDPSIRQKVVTIIRDQVKLADKAAKATLYEEPPTNGKAPLRIGVVDLPSFYAGSDGRTTSDIARLINRLANEHASGIILDLRGNPGGYLEEAVDLSGLFIGKGPVVQTKDTNGVTATRNADLRLPPFYAGPLIVMCSRSSASASEIVAAAMQDYGRGIVVGDKTTYGKGTVQTVQPLTNYMKDAGLAYAYDPGSLHVTIQKFYRASGMTTESNGVVSDIILPSVLNYVDYFVESSQPNSLPADDVTSADYHDQNLVKPFLPELLRRSVQRREHDKDFAYIQEDIDEYKKLQADKSVTMNEAERLDEQKSRKDRMEARKKERTSRPKTGEKVYEITLQNVDDPILHLWEPPKDPDAPKPSLDEDAVPGEDAAEDPTSNDPPLRETRRIMADYIPMLGKPLAAATPPAQR